MLDEITRSAAARQDEVARGALDVQREQLTSLQKQRQAAADLNRQKKALGVIGIDKNPTDPANRLNLAYRYIQVLDTHQSAVREGELQPRGIAAPAAPIYCATLPGASRMFPQPPG
jgi:hypothetical protein